MIKNINKKEIIENKALYDSFLISKLNQIEVECNIFNGNFFADSLNLFPITENFEVFEDVFIRDENYSIKHFYSKNFEKNFKSNIKNFKTIKDAFVLGSSPSDNYYSNLLYFLPRLFFSDKKKNKVVVNRNLSNKFRDLIKDICLNLDIDLSFVFIDENFYRYENSYIPQYIDIISSIKILKYFLLPKEYNKKINKIYVTREDSYYRKLLNESDLIKILKKKGFKIINPQLYDIKEQIDIFSYADIVVGPHGSNLANIIFCKPGASIYEISPKFNKDFEVGIKNRYSNLCKINNLKYFNIISDSVDVEKHSKVATKYVSEKFLSESSIYKNLIIKLKDIENLF